MYFPYFRGRQYELLALRELLQNDLLSKKVIPVIEPVKLSSTFIGTLQSFTDKDHHTALILNPQVGEFDDKEALKVFIPYINREIIPAIIMNDDTDAALQEISSNSIQLSDLLVVLQNQDFVEDYARLLDSITPQYTLFPDERKIRRVVQNGKVLFENRFRKCEKNADYLKNQDEFYSDDHLFYEEEGYSGFGDYSIIGEKYDESGFAPRAVAIHMVYFDDTDALRIHHFVSDSNIGIEDVAGKFYEAVSKLKEWFSNCPKKQYTAALATLIDFAEKGYYPGLPTLKKLSIMHHMEIISKYLDGGVQ
jgi:hypothetical protein